MSTADHALVAVRNKPEYRAGIWAFRATLVIAVIILPNIALSFLPRWIMTFLWIAYLAVMLYGHVQFGRAGVSVTGMSKGVWSRRRMVYRDVFRLGRR